MITNSIAVPETKAPKRFVSEAKSPIAAPPIIVKGIIYLSKILSKILVSCLKPATCNPEAAIFSACARESIPEVFTQKTEKTEHKITNARTWIRP